MSPHDAAKLLEIPADATSEQIETRFLELRAKLEDKIAKAPTPGLKAKYRESLEQITEAFETLTLAADSSSLPVLNRSEPTPHPTETAPTATNPRTPLSPAPRKKSGHGKEFALVALLALLVLIGGGWFVMKTRAENAEKTRIAAAAKAAAERKAEAERLAAEAQRKAEEAERERQEKLGIQLRTRLAELRIEWEILEKQTRAAERELSEAKSALRSAPAASPEGRQLGYQVEALTKYAAWLESYFERHPARLARVRAEEFLSAREIDAAGSAIDAVATAIASAGPEIKKERERLMTFDGKLHLTSTPSGLTWRLTDNFGRTKTGTTPATVSSAPGAATVVFSRSGFKDVSASATVKTSETASVSGTLVSQTIVHQAESDVQFYMNGKFIGQGTARFADAAPKTYDIELRRGNYPPYRTKFEVTQNAETKTILYNFSALAKEDQSCPSCSGRGSFVRTERCSSCGARGTVTCSNCNGRGSFSTFNGEFTMKCQICGGDGREDCRDCTSGKVRYNEACSRCGGDGRMSRLQLAQ